MANVFDLQASDKCSYLGMSFVHGLVEEERRGENKRQSCCESCYICDHETTGERER
jgi:hypothetical protein